MEKKLGPVATARSLQPLVREYADISESQRHLSPEVARAFAENGLYRIAAPEDAFGSAHDPLTQIHTIEAIAQADGSAAWNLMIGIESLICLSRIISFSVDFLLIMLISLFLS